MKKLFSLVLAVALCTVLVLGTAFATDTDLGLKPTDDNPAGNGTITDAVKNAPEGAKLVISVKFNEDRDDVKKGWGVGGICINGGWEVDGDYTATLTEDPVKNKVITFTFDIDSIKKDATGDINVNFYNGFIIEKAVIRTSDGGAAKTADTMTVVLFAGVAVLALVAVVASKKARA